MKIFKTIKDLKIELSEIRQSKKSIGFVPTMGALHKGHTSLIEYSKKQTDITVVSIFVNPTQFNNPEDYLKYPITIESDIEILKNENCDILFNPNEKEMYPEQDTRIFDFGNLENTMEGSFRPGHFNGVAQIVSKLFDAVNPDFAFLEKKIFNN
jgi:pantoate--beta-alanine ligase